MFSARQYALIKPYLHGDTFWRNNSRRLLKTVWPKVKLLMMSNFSFGHNVFNLSYLLWRFYRFLSLCFQSRLLQICCMWERVKPSRLNIPDFGWLLEIDEKSTSMVCSLVSIYVLYCITHYYLCNNGGQQIKSINSRNFHPGFPPQYAIFCFNRLISC